jgi:hypothetical protein
VPAPPAPPAPPNLTATPPAVPVSLVGGGEPAELPITVKNSGGTVSEPVVATLNLPPGVTAIPAGDRYGPAPLVRLDAAPTGSIDCPGGSSVVTCSNNRGLAPGESVTLVFRLVATAGATSGQVTGTVMAGSMINVRVAVRVDVRPPVTVDAIALSADAEWLGLLPGIWLHPTLEARVENTGTSTKPVTIMIDQPAQLIYSNHLMTCTVGGGTSCTTADDVDPDEVVHAVFELDPDPWPVKTGPTHEVHVNATLGTAHARKIVQLHGWLWPVPPGILTPAPSTPAPPPSTAPPGEQPPSDTPTSPEPAEPSHRTPSTGHPPAGPPSSSTDPTDPANPADPTEPPSSSPPERAEPPTSEPAEPPAGGGGLGGLLGWLLGGGR